MMRILYSLIIGLGLANWASAQVNYGADRANKRTIPTGNTLGGRSDFNYLALADHPSRSGVTLGGIGAGNVEFAPNGRFVELPPVAKARTEPVHTGVPDCQHHHDRPDPERGQEA